MSRGLIIKIAITIVVIIILAIVVGAIQGPSEENVPESGLTRDTFVSEDAIAEGREFLQTLQNLQGIQLDGRIFNDPAFMSLVDFSVTLLERARGRVNPFAPIDPNEAAFVVPAQPETSSEDSGEDIDFSDFRDDTTDTGGGGTNP